MLLDAIVNYFKSVGRMHVRYLKAQITSSKQCYSEDEFTTIITLLDSKDAAEPIDELATTGV